MTHGEVHVGVAVPIPDGLTVPVVRNADRKLKPEEFMGSTLTACVLTARRGSSSCPGPRTSRSIATSV